MDKLKFDFGVMLLWPIVASFASFLVQADYFVSIILFLIVPSVYLSFREKEAVKKVFIFSFIVGIVGTISLDYLAHASGVWYINTTIFESRFLSVFPIESFLWGISAVFYPLVFYERFLGKHEPGSIMPSKMKKFSEIMILLGALIFALIAYLPAKFSFPNLYWVICPIFVAGPVIMEYLEYSDYFKKVLEAGIYFFFVSFLYEVTALKLKIWEFPAKKVEFIGWISIFGTEIPFEEVIFYFILFAMAAISTYDIVDNYINHEDRSN